MHFSEKSPHEEDNFSPTSGGSSGGDSPDDNHELSLQLPLSFPDDSSTDARSSTSSTDENGVDEDKVQDFPPPKPRSFYSLLILPLVFIAVIVVLISAIFIFDRHDEAPPHKAVTAPLTSRAAGEHCHDDQIIISSGTITCSKAEQVLHNYDFSHHHDTQTPLGFTCVPATVNVAERFYDVWCNDRTNVFFASLNQYFYKNFPVYPNWLPNVSIYKRESHPGIDFRNSADTIQCIIHDTTEDVLVCTGEQLPGHSEFNPDLPNNEVVLYQHGEPKLTFGNSIEFSYGNFAILPSQHSIFYKNYACTANATEMQCTTILPKKHGFIVSPTRYEGF